MTTAEAQASTSLDGETRIVLPTRAISLKQPWAWAVFNAGKNIENRTWWTEYRGPIWIASSAQVTRTDYQVASHIIERISGVRPPDSRDVVYGAILGRATVSDCILPGGHVATSRPAKNWPAGTAKPPESGGPHPLQPAKWHFPEQFGYVLDDLHALATPVPCKGLQRFWRVPADVLEQLKGAT